MEFVKIILRRLRNIGPGAIVAAAFIGPGTITTATVSGANYGFTLLWSILFSIVATYVLQEMSSRLGVAGHLGVGEAIRAKIANRFLRIGTSILVIGAILIGNAAYEAGNITGAIIGFEEIPVQLGQHTMNLYILIIGLLAFLLLFSGKYKLIENSLIFLVSIIGIVFVFTAIILKPEITQVLEGIFIPSLPKGSLIFVIGLIGTTVVPYNLFLHASAAKKKWSGSEHLKLAKWDTLISVIIGGMITMCILITAAVVFDNETSNLTDINDLGQHLRPILGGWSSTFIAFGFLIAGLSSSITAPLAAAFATSEIFGWENDLKGRYFRFIWIAVLLIGMTIASFGFKPTAVILFSQVANGLLLPIIAIFLLWVVNDKKLLGVHINSRLSNILGIGVIGITVILGLKAVFSAFDVV